MTDSETDSNTDAEDQSVDAEDQSADAEGQSTDAVEPSRDHFREGTFNDWLGLSLDSYSDGEVRLSVTSEGAKQNTRGLLHGGVTASLIDVAAGMTVASTFGDDPPSMVTSGLDVEYLRPITDEAYAIGSIARVGESSAVARVDVESTAPDGERKLAAIGTVTFQRH